MSASILICRENHRLGLSVMIVSVGRSPVLWASAVFGHRSPGTLRHVAVELQVCILNVHSRVARS